MLKILRGRKNKKEKANSATGRWGGLALLVPGFREGNFTARPVAGSHWGEAEAAINLEPSQNKG